MTIWGEAENDLSRVARATSFPREGPVVKRKGQFSEGTANYPRRGQVFGGESRFSKRRGSFPKGEEVLLRVIKFS
jgi:hypothetical protein